MNIYQSSETAKKSLENGPARSNVARPDAAADVLSNVLSRPTFEEAADNAPIQDEMLEALSRGYQANAHAQNTIRAYENDIRRFKAWCYDGGYLELPATPHTIALYLSDHAEFSPASLRRWLVGIALMHRDADYPSPCSSSIVRNTLKGIKREQQENGFITRQAFPLVLSNVRKLVGAIPLDETATLRDLRDRALFLSAWTLAMRRSEPPTLRIQDVVENPRGMIVYLNRKKTNKGDIKPVGMPRAKPENADICPVAAMKAWLSARPKENGKLDRTAPVFPGIDRHGNVGSTAMIPHSINRLIRLRAREAGFEEEVIELMTCHSLRRGLATSATQAKAILEKIMQQGGWKRAETLRHYVELADLFDDNAASAAGL